MEEDSIDESESLVPHLGSFEPKGGRERVEDKRKETEEGEDEERWNEAVDGEEKKDEVYAEERAVPMKEEREEEKVAEVGRGRGRGVISQLISNLPSSIPQTIAEDAALETEEASILISIVHN